MINYDNTVWPCCWVCTNRRGKYLENLPKDWNSLDHHTLDEILNHEAFKTHYNDAHWNDPEKVDIECKNECDQDSK
jgi:hypothetical protein